MSGVSPKLAECIPAGQRTARRHCSRLPDHGDRRPCAQRLDRAMADVGPDSTRISAPETWTGLSCSGAAASPQIRCRRTRCLHGGRAMRDPPTSRWRAATAAPAGCKLSPHGFTSKLLPFSFQPLRLTGPVSHGALLKIDPFDQTRPARHDARRVFCAVHLIGVHRRKPGNLKVIWHLSASRFPEANEPRPLQLGGRRIYFFQFWAHE